MTPTPLAVVGLTAGLQELYFDAEFASAWALSHMTSGSTNARGWLVDLVECVGINDACAALRDGLATLHVNEADFDEVSLRLGFAFLLHVAGGRTRADLLRKAGRLADGAGYDKPECEAFYLLLNEIDGGGPTVPSSVPLPTRVADLFAPHARLAESAEAEILTGWSPPPLRSPLGRAAR